MRNADVLRSVRRYLQEPSEGFYSDSYLKEYLAEAQREMCRTVKSSYEVVRTFSTATGTAAYNINSNIGPDTFGIYLVLYENRELLPLIDELDISHITIPSGTPRSYYIRGGSLGLYPTPSASGTISAYTHRLTPKYLLDIYHDGTNSATNAVVRRSGNYFVCYYTNATASSTNTFGLTSAAYSGIAGLVSGINALGSGFIAVQGNEVRGQEPSTNVEYFDSAVCLNASNRIYVRPELEAPIDAADILIHGVLFRALEEDGKEEEANKRRALWQEGILGLLRDKSFEKRGNQYRTPWAGRGRNEIPLGAGGSIYIT